MTDDSERRERQRDTVRKWRAAHPDYHRQWQQAHPDQVLAYSRAYHERHREEERVKDRTRRAAQTAQRRAAEAARKRAADLANPAIELAGERVRLLSLPSELQPIARAIWLYRRERFGRRTT